MAIVRSETEQDIPLVRKINESAFGPPNAANPVDALRKTAFPHISLVAVEQEDVVGHIFFSHVGIKA